MLIGMTRVGQSGRPSFDFYQTLPLGLEEITILTTIKPCSRVEAMP